MHPMIQFQVPERMVFLIAIRHFCSMWKRVFALEKRTTPFRITGNTLLPNGQIYMCGTRKPLLVLRAATLIMI